MISKNAYSFLFHFLFLSLRLCTVSKSTNVCAASTISFFTFSFFCSTIFSFLLRRPASCRNPLDNSRRCSHNSLSFPLTFPLFTPIINFKFVTNIYTFSLARKRTIHGYIIEIRGLTQKTIEERHITTATYVRDYTHSLLASWYSL